MDVDAFIAAHRAEWDRLQQLLGRARHLSGSEADELVGLYQRVATHLSIVRSATPDPVLVARLSQLVARARAAITGTRTPAWKEVVGFFTRKFPAAVYRARYWWAPTGVLFVVVSAALGWWIAADDALRAMLAPPEQIKELTRPGGQYESYYSTYPAGSFAFQVWANNAFVAARTLVSGILLGIPVVPILWTNAQNLALGIGFMASAGRLDVFLGLVVPHGLLELTAVFIAAGTGLRLGWTIIDPGPRRRLDAFAQEGRAAAGMAIGLTVVLLISGAIEGFVTPSGLPTWARIAIGVAAEVAFLGYVFVLGRRAARAGETGDVDARYAGDTLPTVG